MSPITPAEQPESTLGDRLFALLQFVLPHHLLSRMMHWLTRLEWQPLSQLLIKGAVRLYKVDMTTAVKSDLTTYKSFNAFFTRAIKPESRPIASEESAVASPVDGTVSQFGRIVDGEIFQAKGHSYTLDELLGGDKTWSDAFSDGRFATIYLSPRDYHRIHMPLGGELQKMTHVPGELFSVNPSTTRTVPRLFARNERVVNLFNTERGPMAVIMVGAIFVASMDTVWAGTVAPAALRTTQWNYTDQKISSVTLNKGDEMGRFNMGSTVILLFGNDAVEWEASLKAGKTVQLGQAIANSVNQSENRDTV